MVDRVAAVGERCGRYTEVGFVPVVNPGFVADLDVRFQVGEQHGRPLDHRVFGLP